MRIKPEETCRSARLLIKPGECFCSGTWLAHRTTHACRAQFQQNSYEEKEWEGGTFLSLQRRTGLCARTSERNDPPRMVPDLLRNIGVCRVTSLTRKFP